MGNEELIAKVLAQMSLLEVTQVGLADACGLSQPHLSKVLSNKIKLAHKTEEKLAKWLADFGESGQGARTDTFQALTAKLQRQSPEKRMQFMQLLSILDQLLLE